MIITCPVHDAAARWPKEIAINSGDSATSFSELESRVVGQAQLFRQLGIDKCDRVAILAPNSLEYVLALLSLPRIGASVVPLNRRLNPKSWQTQIELAHVKMLLTGVHTGEDFKHSSVPVYTIGGQDSRNPLREVQPVEEIPTEIETDREATIVLTSGSSGEPKGVILSYGNHYFNALGSNENIPLFPGDCWLLSLPLFHVGGISIVFRTLLGGAAMRIAEHFEMKETNSQIDTGKVTHLSLVPQMLAGLLRERQGRPLPQTLKTILLGGAPIPMNLLDKCRKQKLPILTSYGLTEAASQICTLSLRDGSDRLDTVGRPLRYREVKIVDDKGATCAQGTIGEIAIRGEVLFKGYLGDEGSRTFDGDGWFRTGDMGSLEGDGYLTVQGRKDDMLVSGGENIFPREIEVVAESFPGVTACAVIGVPDEKWGQRPVLFFESTTENSGVVVEMRSFLRERMPGFKVPEAIIRVDTLPRIGIDKIDKSKLLTLYCEKRGS